MRGKQTHLRLVDVTTMDISGDLELRYRSRLRTWLVYWLLWLLLRTPFSLETTHTLDYWRNGRMVYYFPLNAKSHKQLLKLTKLNQMEVTRA